MDEVCDEPETGYPFLKKIFAVEMGKSKIKVNKPVHLGHKILDLSKRLIYEFRFNYMQLKYGSNVKLCYMNADSFVR